MHAHTFYTQHMGDKEGGERGERSSFMDSLSQLFVNQAEVLGLWGTPLILGTEMFHPYFNLISHAHRDLSRSR